MHTAFRPDERLPLLLRSQGGAVSTEQLRSLGAPSSFWRRQEASGLWTRVAPRVFVVGEPSWASLAWAGLLVGGSRSVVGMAAAAHLWGWQEPPREIDVWLPHRREDLFPWRFHEGVRAARLAPDRTTGEETVLDLWPELDTSERVTLLAKAVSSGARPSAILHAANRRTRLAGRQELAEILGDVAGGAHSVLERAYLRDVERPHGLPAAKRQVRQNAGRVDCWYEAFGLLVELDGRLGHAGVGKFRDMHRDNEHLLAGLSTLRFGFVDVRTRSCEVAHMVAAVLSARGWTGQAVCARCRDSRSFVA